MNATSDKRNDETRRNEIETPWISLNATHDVEAWIENYNRRLRRFVKKENSVSHGICFRLIEEGEIFMHTTSEGEIYLDVTPEAEWVAPVICAATGIAAPSSRIWRLSGDFLTPLLLGLSPLIARTRMVLEHDFRLKKY